MLLLLCRTLHRPRIPHPHIIIHFASIQLLLAPLLLLLDTARLVLFILLVVVVLLLRRTLHMTWDPSPTHHHRLSCHCSYYPAAATGHSTTAADAAAAAAASHLAQDLDLTLQAVVTCCIARLVHDLQDTSKQKYRPEMICGWFTLLSAVLDSVQLLRALPASIQGMLASAFTARDDKQLHCLP
jgi:hypothetical protein